MLKIWTQLTQIPPSSFHPKWFPCVEIMCSNRLFVTRRLIQADAVVTRPLNGTSRVRLSPVFYYTFCNFSGLYTLFTSLAPQGSSWCWANQVFWPTFTASSLHCLNQGRKIRIHTCPYLRFHLQFPSEDKWKWIIVIQGRLSLFYMLSLSPWPEMFVVSVSGRLTCFRAAGKERPG